jgi:SP family galactose:H+ symporter-like MFS transporter
MEFDKIYIMGKINLLTKVEADEVLIHAQSTGVNHWRVLSIALAASLSAIMFGYSLKEITSVPIDTISSNYGISLDRNLLQGLLIAIMPFGGLFGSLIAKSFLKHITRLAGMHLALPFLVLSIFIVQITTPTTLFVGRFLEGVCIGYYVSIAPIYLKEISPKHMRATTGTFFGLGKIIGVLTVIILELLLGEGAWRFLLSVTVILALTQSAILAVIGVDTPHEWIARGDTERAVESLQHIYDKGDV